MARDLESAVICTSFCILLDKESILWCHMEVSMFEVSTLWCRADVSILDVSIR